MPGPFSAIEADYPSLVAVDSEGGVSKEALNLREFCTPWFVTALLTCLVTARLERQEMCEMSQASEISKNVWLGPTPDSEANPLLDHDDEGDYDIIIETTDSAQVPTDYMLRKIGQMSNSAPQHVEFPASGSLLAEAHSHPQSDPLVRMCTWIHRLANPRNPADSSEEEQDDDGDIRMKSLPSRPRKFLIHCTDGYTETTLLGLAYFMFAERIPLHTALIKLHREKTRNFFAYPTDIPVLSSIQPHLVPQPSSKTRSGRATSLKTDDTPSWLSRIDGSLPSRILPHMYLGNLTHANNPDLLRALGIRQILSVGEPVSWPRTQIEAWGKENILFLNDVQDNGVDSLTKDFDRCLNFIGMSPTFYQHPH